MNSVILMGRIANEIELKYTQSGKAVANVTIAVDGYKKEDTQFIKCIVWDKSAEYLGNYHVKGNRILLEGRIENRTWKAEDGTNRFATEIVANKVTGIDYKPKDGSASEPIVEEEFEDMFADE